MNYKNDLLWSTVRAKKEDSPGGRTGEIQFEGVDVESTEGVDETPEDTDVHCASITLSIEQRTEREACRRASN